MLIGSTDDVTITNDGTTILKEIDIDIIDILIMVTKLKIRLLYKNKYI
jgi:chaperonin GroEL (HSP60 family)